MRTKPGWLKFPQTIPEIHDDKICPNALFRNIFEFCFSKMSWSNCIRGLELCSFLDFRFDFLRPLASKSMVRLFMQMPRVCHLAGPVVVVRTLEHRESPWLGRWSCIKIHKWIEEKNKVKLNHVTSTMIQSYSMKYEMIWNVFFPNASCSSCSFCSYLLALHCSWFFLPHGSQSRIFLQHPFQILV